MHNGLCLLLLTKRIMPSKRFVHRYGGAFFSAVGPQITFDRCLFDNNTASNNGGAMKLTSSSLEDGSWADQEGIRILDCVFRNNSAINVNGGAVFYDGSGGSGNDMLYISDSTFFGNNASSGGALCAWGVSFIQIDGCLVDHNTAYYGRGGGLYVYGE